ncbi:MAG TPA: alpha/beta hydrolase [Chloroflexota bacterium]
MQQQPSIWVSLMGSSVRYVDAKGMRTRVVEAGSGDPLIMLHGSGGHAEAYCRNVVPLGEHFHTYAIDCAGHGYTDKHPTLSGTAAIADHVLRFMDAEGINQANLAGESMGGATSAKLALEHPDRVKKVVYITGAGLEMGEEAAKLASAGRESFLRLTQAAFSAPTKESVRQRLNWLFADPEISVTDELVDVRYTIYSRRQDELAEAAAAAQNQGGRQAGGGVGVSLTPERLREIKAPFFFLWTDHNPTTPWQVAEMAHKQMPGSRFHVIEHAGHWPQYEQTEEFNQVVIDFLKN